MSEQKYTPHITISADSEMVIVPIDTDEECARCGKTISSIIDTDLCNECSAEADRLNALWGGCSEICDRCPGECKIN